MTNKTRCFFIAIATALLVITAELLTQTHRIGFQQFDAGLWRQMGTRHECVDELMASRRLIGMTSKQAQAFLGDPDRVLAGSEIHVARSTDKTTPWRYAMDASKDKDAFDVLERVVVFNQKGTCQRVFIFLN